MANYIVTDRIRVNIIHSFAVPPRVKCEQYDGDYTKLIQAIVYNGDVLYSIPSAVRRIVVSGLKPDGNGFSYDCTWSGNTVSFSLMRQMTVVDGKVPCNITMFDASNNQVSSAVFVLDVEKAALPSDVVVSSNDFQTFIDYVQAANLYWQYSKSYAVGNTGIREGENVDNAKYYAHLARMYKGSPLTASTISEMVDVERTYVYVGNESGYNNGHWYFYDDNAWVDGGVYNSEGIQTDTELIAEGVAADAKAVGDVLGHETLTTTAQTLRGAVNELLEDIKDVFVTPEMFGAVGDGIADDAQAINDAIASGYNVLFNKDKTYLVKANMRSGYACGIYVGRKVILNFNGATIKVDKDNQTYCYGCYIVANDVKLINPHIDGGCASDAVSITYSDSHGICVRSADNVTIINALIENCYGDGLYITNANNIKIIGDNFFKKIGRNGISIIKANGAYIDSLYCEDIKYNAPYCAVDIEPNDYTQDIVNIYINKCVAINCINGVSTVGVGGRLSANIKAIICKNCSGSCFSANYIISNDSGSQVHVNDENKIIVDDVIAVNMKNTIINLKNTNASKMPFISVRNVSAYNYSADNSGGTINYTNAFVYYLQAVGVTGFDHHGNFEVLNIHVDNADILPLTIRDNISGHPDNIDNVLVEVKTPVHNEISNNGTFKGVLRITPPPLEFGVIPSGGSDQATYKGLVDKLLAYSYGEYFIYGRLGAKGTIGSGMARITENDSMGGNANLVSDSYWCSLRIYHGGTFRAYENVGTTVV